MVNGKHMTVEWNVDDINISHTDDSEVSKMLEWIEENIENMNRKG